MIKDFLAALSIRLTSDASQLQDGFNKASKSMFSLQKAATQLGGTLAAMLSVRALVQLGVKAAESYDQQIQAEQQLLVALKGRFGAQQMLINQASQLQYKTLFGDEEIVKAQALIAAFTKEENAIKRIMPLVADLAQAKGIDLASAADLVSKTLGSSTNALKRWGIDVEGSVGSTERLTTIIDGLSRAFEGTAEAATKVGLGPWKLMIKSIGEITETLGGAIVNTNAFGNAVDFMTTRAMRLNAVLTSEHLTRAQKFLSIISNYQLAYNYRDAMAYAEADQQKAQEINFWSALQNQIHAAEKAVNAYNKAKGKGTGKIPFTYSQVGPDPGLHADESIDLVDPFAVEQSEYAYETAYNNMIEDLRVYNDALEEEAQRTQEILTTMESGFENAVVSWSESFGSLAAGAEDFNPAAAFLGPIADMLSALGKALIASGIGIEAFKKSFETLQGIPALIAGAALVSLAAYMKQSIQNIPTNSGAGAAGYASSTPSAGVNIGSRYYGDRDNVIIVEGRLSGDDLVISNRRSQLRTALVT